MAQRKTIDTEVSQQSQETIALKGSLDWMALVGPNRCSLRSHTNEESSFLATICHLIAMLFPRTLFDLEDEKWQRWQFADCLALSRAWCLSSCASPPVA
jgi:hypothetical protein